MAFKLYYTTLVVLILLVATHAQNQTNLPYTLVKNYTGQAFFDGFDFFSGPDPSASFVKYVDLDTANNAGMAGYVSNSELADPVYLGPEFSSITPDGRPSVRLQGKDFFNHSLMIADIVHMPYGCGVWPAFWLLGQGAPWPTAGEIDIIEGINNESMSTFALHTDAGVTVKNLTNMQHGNQSMEMEGTFTSLDCSVGSSNTGCAAKASWNNYGQEFNANGGGVVVTEVSSKAIQIWSFSRDNIPGDILDGTPNPHHWSPPEVKFVYNGNDTDILDQHFKNLQPIFNIAFCGAWANSVWNTSECASLAPTCESYVANNPTAFVDTFWAIGELQVYEPNSNSTSGYGGPELDSESAITLVPLAAHHLGS
ncbi:hypothetical protein LTR10_019126 [Elasticomyces elasticus]|uniref:GH16 domain-containing protein n=1 Tax=Exophiala sideris TaxID=1016849 RepID=A0ABR0JH14_9EURO|nr:hypothetical protein LTR10_019126 [Elasticomyces elasticus]KAK5033466.1 hypothetical protein LTS07_003770 [Exophiala sideris]KAK5042039.1 hypothetical protein LTR13_001845 [Exophiala sideris]KAK5064010.1 hypothetical protein LTR69_003778 [Exophiala sideris]KAK5185307.1 hypothetical protein LTR44_002296 [Eurotiomycetes sp. CCFEE 6388]